MSDYLSNIIARQHGATNVMVVFIDIVRYSLRKSVMQQKVIYAFNVVLQEALDIISAKHVKDAQRQNLNLANDIIKIPTGDGAAVVFPFQGIQTIHLDLAVSFLSCTVATRKDASCSIFAEHGWCNCHDFFDVRIGLSEGKSIIFKDINGSYNVAGGPVNLASRVMGLCDRQQILATDAAFRSIIDMTEDTALEDRFRVQGCVPIKHDLSIDVVQYIGAGENFINTEIPVHVEIARQAKKITEFNPTFRNLGPQSPEKTLRHLAILDTLKGVRLPKAFEDLFTDEGSASLENLHKVVEALRLISPLWPSSEQQLEQLSRDASSELGK